MPITHPTVRTPQQGLVLTFSDIDATMLGTVGGKAANLGELTRAKLPVPAGMCVTTAAYRQVAEQADGLRPVLDALADTSADDLPALTALAGRARTALLSAPVPPAVTEAIRDGYAALGTDAPVAVRSSATAEDLPFASFAGQQDTYLNVVGEAAVLDAVRRCWASLWTDRAVTYRTANGIDHAAVQLAVVVQRLVVAEVSGVLFTANPVTGRRREAVIDASPGLGEAVVSGAVNPDHFLVDTASGEIRHRRLGDKRLAIHAVPGGGTRQIERSDGADRACLRDDQVRALANLGDQVESHFGAPQDTEWAIDAEEVLWLLQARPVTTLYPLPEPRADGLRVYFCGSLAQGLNRPITPMGLATFRLLATAAADLVGVPVADPLAGPARYADAGQRLFVDVTGILRSRVGRALLPRVFDVMEARSAVVLRGLAERPELSLTRRSVLPFARRMAGIAVRHRVPLTAARALHRPEQIHRELAALLAETRRHLVLPETASAAERLDLVERVLRYEVISVMPRVAPAALAGFAMLALTGKLMRRDLQPGELQTVLRGLPHNVTTEMDLALWELATRIRADEAAARELSTGSADELAEKYRAGTLAPVAQAGLRDFLAEYGQRAVAEIDIGMPRWSEDPRHILGVLANYLRLDDPARAPDAVFAAGARQAEQMVSTLVDRAGPRRGRVVGFALGRARALAGLREFPKYYLVVVLAGLRAHLAAVGTELAAAGRLAAADDVFFLDLVEARAGLAGTDLTDLVAQRRESYDQELRRRHVPRVLLSDGTEPERDPALRGPGSPALAAADGALAGTPASAGTVTGTARVVLDPVGAHLEPGEILVAPSTDPGWTPLFLTAGGLVMEMGGANSHGAVVAREYGIPAVVGVAEATLRISTGQEITVDGSTGLIVQSTPEGYPTVTHE